jgi:hypothetical protein
MVRNSLVTATNRLDCLVFGLDSTACQKDRRMWICSACPVPICPLQAPAFAGPATGVGDQWTR